MPDARGKYREFHGHRERRVTGIEYHPPGTLILLGEAVAIEYRCNKFNGGGDGKRAVYRHEFERSAVLCMDERGKRQLYILGPAIRVDEAGIRK